LEISRSFLRAIEERALLRRANSVVRNIITY
jgi:hypothetical protein